MKNVLLIEDSPTEAAQLQDYLEQEGFSVYRASSSEEAEIKIKGQKPNLIVLDIILPGKSGFELCRKLKEQPETQKIPIILCSTKNTEVDMTWGKMGGADAYLTKPVNSQTLVETVSQFIA
ncbi:MAG: response regulator [Cyanobacteria bacterium]|jgi:twitching motility two-component system response regulator PilH|nr:response regulator [Cyanobacteria bacterium GSL.Bin21]